MSLQVWLPLTKDLRNQGLNGISVTSTGTITLNDSGKLGKCYKTSNTGFIDLKYAGTQINTGSISLCGWFKFNKSELAATWSSYSFDSSHPYPTGNLIGNNSYGGVGLIWYTNSLASGAAFTSLYVACSIRSTANGARITNVATIPFDTWVHLALVFNKTTKALELWMNSELKVTNTMLDFDDARSDSLKLNYSAVWGGNGPSYNIPFYVNDVRIYDHALSPMEIKQLSQGLVLHYLLNRGGFGNENLLSRYVVPGQAGPTSTAAGGRTTWLGDYKITIPATENADTYFRLFMSEQLVSGQTYTISCQVDGLLSGSVYRFPMFAQSNTAMGVLNLDHNGLNSLTFTMNWTGTQTAATGANGETVYVNFLDDSARTIASGQGPITISNFKLEEGDKVTPWCPNILDSLYDAMGLNGTTEYDCSGFCNNGTRTGTFSWTSDTPKYSVSQSFNGTDNAIQTPDLTTLITDKNYTIACWFYKTAIGTKSYQTIYGGPSGFELEARNGGGTEPQLVAWNWGKPIVAYEFNKWNHFVFVHSDNDCKIYLNGEYVSTGTAKATNPSGNYFVGAWNASTSQNYEGLMSDFRIYATALSPTDVKSLYQNCATIDADGTIHGQIRS